MVTDDGFPLMILPGVAQPAIIKVARITITMAFMRVPISTSSILSKVQSFVDGSGVLPNRALRPLLANSFATTRIPSRFSDEPVCRFVLGFA